MNQTRTEAIVAGLRSNARKVLDSVPLGDSWTLPQIMDDLKRRGLVYDIATVQGCLRALEESSLVRLRNGGFQSLYHPRPKADGNAAQERPTIQVVKPKPVEPLAMLAAFSARLRAQASDLTRVADEIDEAAIEIAQAMESAGSTSDRFAKLKGLLREIVVED